MRRVIMGAGGRDFHNFDVAYREDPNVEVVAFTATQIPGIDDRAHPPAPTLAQLLEPIISRACSAR
jgi:predicted GTPase